VLYLALAVVRLALKLRRKLLITCTKHAHTARYGCSWLTRLLLKIRKRVRAHDLLSLDDYLVSSLRDLPIVYKDFTVQNEALNDVPAILRGHFAAYIIQTSLFLQSIDRVSSTRRSEPQPLQSEAGDHLLTNGVKHDTFPSFHDSSLGRICASDSLATAIETHPTGVEQLGLRCRGLHIERTKR
jgi:hypothetical protein